MNARGAEPNNFAIRAENSSRNSRRNSSFATALFETMKPTHSPTRATALLATLSLLPTLGHAHPGHAAFDWFSGAPHAGHESEYAVVLSLLAIAALACGIWMLSRKR